MTEPARRPRLIPKTAIIAAAVIVALIASALSVAYLVSRSRMVEAPDVTGLPLEEAEALLEDAGLRPQASGTRVSVDVKAGHVIAQFPAPGTRLEKGSPVGLVISAGPQTYEVPDLIGSPVDGARQALQALGFDVLVETVSAETTEAVVLEMFPAPGAKVAVGDTIRLKVPGDASDSDALMPYNLQGVTVLLDPQPAPATATAEAPLEIARRLRSLLEAAGATVATTRQPSSEPASPEDRQAIVDASEATVLVGIDLGSSGVAGITVQHLPQENAGERERDSLLVARAITRAAALPGLTVNEPAEVTDPMLSGFRGAGVRVVVGDSTVNADVARLTDPAWADQIARAIYRGIGTTLASE